MQLWDIKFAHKPEPEPQGPGDLLGMLMGGLLGGQMMGPGVVSRTSTFHTQGGGGVIRVVQSGPQVIHMGNGGGPGPEMIDMDEFFGGGMVEQDDSEGHQHGGHHNHQGGNQRHQKYLPSGGEHRVEGDDAI